MLTHRNAFGAVLLLGTMLLLAAGGAARETADIARLDAYRPDDRQMAADILEHATFEADRQTSVRADAAVFAFLVDHPDFAAAVNRGLGLEKFQIRAEGQRYHVTHGYARGTFWAAERDPDHVAYLGTGTYGHPLLRATGIHLRARSFVVVTFEFDSPQTPTSEVRVHVHAYLQIENSVLGPVLRRFSPLVRGAFESKVTAGHRIGPDLSAMAFREPESFLERVRQIKGLDPYQLAQFEELVRAHPARRLARSTFATGLASRGRT